MMMEDRIREILANVLKIDAKIISASFSQESFAAWDSLAQLNLVVALEREFAIEFEPDEIGAMIDFTAVVAKVGRKL
jgi:acyl carrier protein